MEEKINLKLDASLGIARLIIETAEFQARCSPVGVDPKDWSVRLTAEHVSEAANYVFLALHLIAERGEL